MRFATTPAACGLALCTLLLATSFVTAQEQRPRDRDRGSVVLRTYEVGDLVVHVPDYELAVDSALASAQGGGNRGGGFGGGGGGMFGGRGMEGGFAGGMG